MIGKERAIDEFVQRLNDHLGKDSKLVIEVGYNKDKNSFFVEFDTHLSPVSYFSQFDSDRIHGEMLLGDFVVECKSFIEEIKVEIGSAIVRSYK